MLFLGNLNVSAEAGSNGSKIKLVNYWKKSLKNNQNFILYSNEDEITGNFKWDLEKKTWIFEYDNAIWEIKNEKMFKTDKKDGSVKEYKCSGIGLFLSHSLEEWDQIFENVQEVCTDDQCILYAKYKTIRTIWKYKKEPFELLSIAFAENNRYSEIIFQVKEENMKEEKN
jgi:hypothetical protein